MNKKSYEKVELITGIKASPIIELEEISLIPELRAISNYKLKGKVQRIEARLEEINFALPSKKFKPEKVLFNLGMGLTAKRDDIIEYDIHYNTIIAKKYLGHQGSIKVKLYF